MTEFEKHKINELRLNGYGYKKIAKELGLSVNTVKSYLARVKVEEPAVEAKDICPNCGNKLIYIPGHKKKRFCSDKCRMSWWNSHLDKVNRLANRIVVCAQCRQEFTAYGKRERKYCSRKCYVKARFGGSGNGSVK